MSRLHLQLVRRGYELHPGLPSHQCDSCGRTMHVRPIPWQLAWPTKDGGDECSDCHFCDGPEDRLHALLDRIDLIEPVPHIREPFLPIRASLARAAYERSNHA